MRTRAMRHTGRGRESARSRRSASDPGPQVSLRAAVQLRVNELEAAGRSKPSQQVAERVGRRFASFLGMEGTGGPAPLSALTAANVRAFLAWLRTDFFSQDQLSGRKIPLGERAVAQHAIELKTLARFCWKEGLLATDPMATLRAPRVAQKVIESFTPDQVRRMLREADAGPQALRDRAIVYFLLATGVRAGELCGLALADLDLRERRARIFGKGRKERWVNFDPVTARHLARYLLERGEGAPDDGVFLGRTGNRLSRNGLLRLCWRLGAGAGIAGQVRCSPHTFRHCFAVNFLRAHPGAVLHLQQQLGHSDLSMTRRYARLADTDAPPPGPTVIEMLGLEGKRRPGR